MFHQIYEKKKEFAAAIMAKYWNDDAVLEEDTAYLCERTNLAVASVEFPTLQVAHDVVADLAAAVGQSEVIPADIIVKLAANSNVPNLYNLRIEENDRYKPNEIIRTLIEAKTQVTFCNMSMHVSVPQYHSLVATIVSSEGDHLVVASAGSFRPNTRYVLRYQITIVPDVTKNRVAVSLGSLTGLLMNATPLVAALLKYDPRGVSPPPFYIPPANNLMQLLDFTTALGYLWGLPGVGKTRHLALLAKRMFSVVRLAYFVAPTNAALISLSDLLVLFGVKHWVFAVTKHIDDFKQDPCVKHLIQRNYLPLIRDRRSTLLSMSAFGNIVRLF